MLGPIKELTHRLAITGDMDAMAEFHQLLGYYVTHGLVVVHQQDMQGPSQGLPPLG